MTRRLADAPTASYFLWTMHRVKVKPATIRQWACRKKITTHAYGRRRYDLREVEEYARKKGLIAK